MSYWIYSNEALPATHLMGKVFGSQIYNPERITWNGQSLQVPEKKWTKLPDSFTTIRRSDWKDRQGTEVEIPIHRFRGVIAGQFAERGVIFLDHEPTDQEKFKLERLSMELNHKFRARQIEWYESQRQEKMSGNPGRLWPTAYEQECYELLGVQKPYSVEAFKAMREPGGEAAKRIAEAIKDALAGARDEGKSSAKDVPLGTLKPSTPQPLTGVK